MSISATRLRNYSNKRLWRLIPEWICGPDECLFDVAMDAGVAAVVALSSRRAYVPCSKSGLSEPTMKPEEAPTRQLRCGWRLLTRSNRTTRGNGLRGLGARGGLLGFPCLLARRLSPL